jgi:hypothetical protein
MTSFHTFPPKEQVVARLREVEELTLPTQHLFEQIGGRIGSKTLDGAAFTFLLMELIHEHELSWAQDLGYLLPRAIVALTGDHDLARTAQRAFEEIKESLADDS